MSAGRPQLRGGRAQARWCIRSIGTTGRRPVAVDSPRGLRGVAGCERGGLLRQPGRGDGAPAFHGAEVAAPRTPRPLSPPLLAPCLCPSSPPRRADGFRANASRVGGVHTRAGCPQPGRAPRRLGQTEGQTSASAARRHLHARPLSAGPREPCSACDILLASPIEALLPISCRLSSLLAPCRLSLPRCPCRRCRPPQRAGPGPLLRGERAGGSTLPAWAPLGCRRSASAPRGSLASTCG